MRIGFDDIELAKLEKEMNKIKEGIDKMNPKTKEKLKKDIEEAMTIGKLINSPSFGINKE